METLNSGYSGLDALLRAVAAAGDGALPVEKWNPKHCGSMDMVIRRDGSWWHEGGRITRAPLVKLFASVLRKDTDGETYLVTPAEKIRIQVQALPFLAVRLDVKGRGKSQRLFFTTNIGDVIEAGAAHPIDISTDKITLEPTPLIHVRGRLQALMSRPVFYELVALAKEQNNQLGVYAANIFFPLGPPNIHSAGIDSAEP